MIMNHEYRHWDELEIISGKPIERINSFCMQTLMDCNLLENRVQV